MKKLGFIQELIGKRILSYKAKRHVRVSRTHNLESAKTIGIVFDANDQKIHKEVIAFADTLKKKHNIQVVAIGFVKNKNILSTLQGYEGFEYFTKHDYSWYGSPKSLFVTNFITKKFDILIDVTLSSSYPFNYIMRLSNACFRVGRYSEITENHDLMIDIQKEKTIDYLIKQILVYLLMIQVPKT